MNDNMIINYNDLILITGANGFIGSRVIECLIRYGFKNIRCFVRPSSDLTRLNKILASGFKVNVDIIKDNLLSKDACKKATSGVALIYHLVAGFGKSFAGCYMNSVITTRNLLESTLQNKGLKRFVNVSSFAVYSNMSLRRGKLFDETCEIEKHFMEKADAYGFGKAKQDELVMDYSKKYGIPYVLLRPGSVYGPGTRQAIPPRVGTDSLGIFLEIGGGKRLPLSYVDNCAEAIVLAGLVKGVDGEIFNVVDDNLPKTNKFVKMYKKNVGKFKSLKIPYWLFYLFSSLWEKYSKWSKGQLPPVFNRRKCSEIWKGNKYSNQKLKNYLNWKPRVSYKEAVSKYFEYLKESGIGI